MSLKRPLIISSLLHALLLALLMSGIDWSFELSKPKPLPIEARLIVKKQKDKNHLPKKPKPQPSSQEMIEPKDEKPPTPIAAKPEEKIVPQAETKTQKAKAKPARDYIKDLASLSQSFAKELDETAKSEPQGDEVTDQNYFDQVYTLIKESFVVPAHLNGPQGQGLSAVLRLFLAADGSLSKLDLMTSSGDEYFDKAVIEGTKRVNNFGAVPIFLQDSLRQRGIIVQLCPIKCSEQ